MLHQLFALQTKLHLYERPYDQPMSCAYQVQTQADLLGCVSATSGVNAQPHGSDVILERIRHRRIPPFVRLRHLIQFLSDNAISMSAVPGMWQD